MGMPLPSAGHASASTRINRRRATAQPMAPLRTVTLPSAGHASASTRINRRRATAQPMAPLRTVTLPSAGHVRGSLPQIIGFCRLQLCIEMCICIVCV
jgi:hypothetical protein